MTVQRQERYDRRPGMAFFALVPVFFAAACLDSRATAATTERVVASRYSGLAIGGFDPVAYFTDQAALQGLPDFEAAVAGVVWRFRNEGNRASFLAHPKSTGPSSAATIRSISRAGSPMRAIRASLW